tara:strand:+ start:643 stop:807 length:165 start_codon:yes stop_codon:yes gene_type:complete
LFLRKLYKVRKYSAKSLGALGKTEYRRNAISTPKTEKRIGRFLMYEEMFFVRSK